MTILDLTKPAPVQDGAARVANGPPDRATAVRICLEIGWTLALLHTPDTAASMRDQLPSEHELDWRDRTDLELSRLTSLLAALNDHGQIALQPCDLNAAWRRYRASAPGDGGEATLALAAFKATLAAFNLSILTTLAEHGREMGRAYQLGRSLRDTANPLGLNAPPSERAKSFLSNKTPAEPTRCKVQASLERQRIARLQEWLAMLAEYFQPHAAKVVSSSLGRWSDLATVTLVENGPSDLRGFSRKKAEKFAGTMIEYLLPQGDVWLGVLLGSEVPKDLLSAESYVAAGDAALRRTSRLVGKVLWRYKWGLLVLLAILGGVIAVAVASLGGVGKVVTVAGTAASGLGITTKKIGAELERVADGGTGTRALETAALAWSVTTLPEVKVRPGGVRYLRRAGAASEVPLGAT
jgi:hypothetical protein